VKIVVGKSPSNRRGLFRALKNRQFSNLSEEKRRNCRLSKPICSDSQPAPAPTPAPTPAPAGQPALAAGRGGPAQTRFNSGRGGGEGWMPPTATAAGAQKRHRVLVRRPRRRAAATFLAHARKVSKSMTPFHLVNVGQHGSHVPSGVSRPEVSHYRPSRWSFLLVPSRHFFFPIWLVKNGIWCWFRHKTSPFSLSSSTRRFWFSRIFLQ